MTKEQKNEVIEALKEKFSRYSNFYVTNTESLSVDQVTKLRRVCFSKNVEMKVAKNTLIKKALESFNNESYNGVFDSLNHVTALMFSENPKEPALILSSFRKDMKGERPELKAAFINGDIYTGDNNLVTLTKIKTKNELIGEVIGLLQSPAKRVLAALLHHHEKGGVVASAKEEAMTEAPVAQAPAAEAAVPVEVPGAALPVPEVQVSESPVAEAPVVDAPNAEAESTDTPDSKATSE